jgi:hypothetical protein
MEKSQPQRVARAQFPEPYFFALDAPDCDLAHRDVGRLGEFPGDDRRIRRGFKQLDNGLSLLVGEPLPWVPD